MAKKREKLKQQKKKQLKIKKKYLCIKLMHKIEVNHF